MTIKRKRKNWKRFFEQNSNVEEFSMYRIIRNLPLPRSEYSNEALIQLKSKLQARYGIKIN